MRVGKLSLANFELLATRHMACVSSAEVAEFANKLHIFPTKADVANHNHCYIRDLGRPVIVIKAESSSHLAQSTPEDDAGGLHV